NGISEGEAAVLLMGDLEKLEVAVLKTYPWVSKLSPARRGVIVEMAFNLGMGGLAKFKKFLVAAQRGDYAEASVEMLDSTWARQVKKRATRLSEIMKTGKE
ncbi:MAG: glycoside hydrolase family protein, partial [Alphaproteobacteria bacterium]|nr:glycoside hydrolase family protein [Alphaproteobacteria bacterium]